MKRFVYAVGYVFGKILGYSFVFYIAFRESYDKIVGKKSKSVYLHITPRLIKALRKESESRLMTEHREN